MSRVPVDELKLVSCWEQSRLDSRMAPLTLTVHGMLLQGTRHNTFFSLDSKLCFASQSYFPLSPVCRLMANSDMVVINCIANAGCNFDGQKLSESLLDSAANSSLGECFFAWVPGDAPSPYPVRL